MSLRRIVIIVVIIVAGWNMYNLYADKSKENTVIGYTFHGKPITNKDLEDEKTQSMWTCNFEGSTFEI